MVLKVQRPHRRRPRTSLAKEAHLLHELGPVLGDRIPRPLGYDQLDTDEGPVEYLCLSRVPGRAVGQLPLTPEERRLVVAELGPLLRRLHGARIDPSATPVDADIVHCVGGSSTGSATSSTRSPTVRRPSYPCRSTS
jgi:aminoglycoside phosphotransferase (APT) family kinase protein